MFRFQGLGTIENYHDVSFRKPAPSTDVLRVSQCLRRKGVKLLKNLEVAGVLISTEPCSTRA